MAMETVVISGSSLSLLDATSFMFASSLAMSLGWLLEPHHKEPSPAKQRVVDDHEYYGANRCYDEAIKIQTRTTARPKQIS